MKKKYLIKKLCVVGLVVSSVFAGVTTSFIVGNVNVEDIQAATTYPIYVKRNIKYSDNHKWISMFPNYLEKNEIKLYRLDFDRYKKIIDEEGGYEGHIYNSVLIPIQERTLAEARLCDKWSASESNHQVNLSDGDYFISVNGFLRGNFPVDTYFSLSESGTKLQIYEGAGGGYNNITMKTVYDAGKTGSSRTLALDVYDGYGYVEPDIVILDPSGKNITEKCEIEVYKKTGQLLEKNPTTHRTDSIQMGAYTWNESNVPYGSAIVVYIEHPALHVIRCVKVPDEYNKFKDITISAETRETGYPHVNIYDSNNENVTMNERQYYYWRKSTPARVEITLQKAVVPDDIKLNKNFLLINKGRDARLTATVSPSNITDKTVTWKSENPKIATVDKDGNVKGVGQGLTTVTATTKDGNKVASCKVRVQFTDVTNTKSWEYTPIYWAADRGITTGAGGKFAPTGLCTREQAVTFLWRMWGSPAPKNLNSKFIDVQNKNSYSYKAIMWASENGIVTGAGGKFAPSGTCTREQIVTILWRLAGKPEPKTKTSPFSDVKNPKSYSYKAILWASEKGITTGANGKFAPTGKCLRREMVTFLYRYNNLYHVIK